MIALVRKLRAVLSDRGGERGVVLITALLVMVFLLPLGVIFLQVALTENTVASNEVSAARSFHLSEAGIQHAKKALEALDLSQVLDGTTSVFPGGNTVNLAGGSYTVQVTNNIAATGFPRGTIPADGAGSATVDDDRIVVLTATGSFQGGQKAVEAVVQVPLVVAPGAVYTMDGTDIDEPAEVEDLDTGSGAWISGNDCNPPSAGGGAGPGPNQPGIAVQTANAQTEVVASLDTDLPGVTGVNGSGDVQITPNAMSDAEFNAWVTDLIAQATPVGSGNCGNSSGSGSNKFGTWASPETCYAETNATDGLGDLIPNGSTGAGILIIKDLDPTTVIDPITGLPIPDPGASSLRDFVYEGIVVVIGDGRFRLEESSRIYGAVIQKNVTGSNSGETRLRVRDDSQICYSSLAVAQAYPGVLGSMMAWYER
ncbi:MAG: hypothetical protein ACE5MG_12630 [Candidatus Methylomirabilales bacterium]